jgi:hypothetical protein
MGIIAAVRTKHDDDQDVWTLSSNREQVVAVFDEDRNGVIWVDDVSQLETQLKERHPSGPGTSRVISTYGGAINVYKEPQPVTVQDLKAAMSITQAGGPGTHVELHWSVVSELRGVRDTLGTNRTCEKGDFVFYTKCGCLFVEYNPRRAKSLRTRRANAAEREQTLPAQQRKPSMPLLSELCRLSNMLRGEIDSMFPHGIWLDINNYYDGSKLHHVSEQIAKLCTTWRTIRRSRSYRSRKRFKEWMKKHLHHKRPEDPTHILNGYPFFDWFEAEKKAYNRRYGKKEKKK